jgi:hypothetical protein
MGAQASQDAGVMRMQEANQAQQLLGLNLHGMREQDEGMSRFNAGQGNEMSQAQMYGTLKQQGQNDDASFRAIGGLQNQNNALASRPSTGERLLAGGAGLYSMYATGGASTAANAAMANQGYQGGSYGYGGYGQSSPSAADMFSMYNRNGGPVTSPSGR